MKFTRHWRELGPSNLTCIHLTSEQWAVIHQVLNQCQFSPHQFLFVKDNECKSRPLILSSSHPSAAHKQHGKPHHAVSLPSPLQQCQGGQALLSMPMHAWCNTDLQTTLRGCPIWKWEQHWRVLSLNWGSPTLPCLTLEISRSLISPFKQITSDAHPGL